MELGEQKWVLILEVPTMVGTVDRGGGANWLRTLDYQNGIIFAQWGIHIGVLEEDLIIGWPDFIR